MEAKMKVVGRKMAIRMGILMSFALSLVGTLTSGHFTPVGFLLSFIVSSIISLIIGFLVPVGKITNDFCVKRNLIRGTFAERCVSSLISDLIYTPIITLAMVFLAYTIAMKMSGGAAGLVFLPMFLKSLIICFVVAFILIFVVQPILMRQIMKEVGGEEQE